MASYVRKSIETAHAGILQCDVVGDLEKASTVILTVHDLGCNSTEWASFINHPSMAEVTSRATYLHVNLPGQEDFAAELPTGYKYPSMDDLAEALLEVCKGAGFSCPVIALGEGAGANIVARFALAHPESILGAVLIHCTSSTAGFMESLKDKTINWKLLGGMNPTAENYLVLHRFGHFERAENPEQIRKVVAEFHEHLNKSVNSKNLRGYIETFMNRSNIADRMDKLTVPLLIITGQQASHNHTVHTFYNACLKLVKNRKLVEYVEVPDVANILEGAPASFASTLQYFIQGQGLLPGAPMPHVTRRKPSLSGVTMESLDKSDM